MMNDRVTEHFTLGEFVISDYAARWGIDNTPTTKELATLRNVLIPAMEQIRSILGTPIIIKSGYRCAKLNAAIRGSPSSQHTTGHAADFISPSFGTPREVCAKLVAEMARIKFDQLICEGGAWAHVSFSPRPRNQVLTAHFTSSGVSYTQGLA